MNQQYLCRWSNLRNRATSTNDNVHHSCTQCICRECPHNTILRRTNTLRCQGSLICPKRSRPRLVGTCPPLLPSSHQLDSMQRRICIQILCDKQCTCRAVHIWCLRRRRIPQGSTDHRLCNQRVWFGKILPHLFHQQCCQLMNTNDNDHHWCNQCISRAYLRNNFLRQTNIRRRRQSPSDRCHSRRHLACTRLPRHSS